MSKKNEESLEEKYAEKREWFRSSDDVRVGYIQGATFSAKQIEYSVIDGLAIFEGDICLGTVEDISIKAVEFDAEQLTARGIAYGVAITGEEYRWPGGRVPYEIDGGVPQQTRDTIQDAIDHWEDNTHISFIQRTTTNASQYQNYVRFIRGTGCWSYVGMRGNRQDISIGAGCGFGAAVHEVGHALGLWHEQSREDRDRFVRINWQNIQTDRAHNFAQHISDGDDIGSYDYDSIMHYGRFAFTKNGKETITPLGEQQIGQRNGLSNGDIAAIRALYPSLEPPPQTARLFRYWGNSDHFYTTAWSELGHGRHGYVYEGIQCYIHPRPATGSTPLFRYYKHSIRDHFYTTYWSELGAGKYGYVLEGIQGYVYSTQHPGTIPLYRYWNPRIGDHFYTTSWGELGSGSHGWRYEMIQCYVFPLPPVTDVEELPEKDEWVTEPEDITFAVIDEELQQTEKKIEVTDSFTTEEEIEIKGKRSITLKIELDDG